MARLRSLQSRVHSTGRQRRRGFLLQRQKGRSGCHGSGRLKTIGKPLKEKTVVLSEQGGKGGEVDEVIRWPVEFRNQNPKELVEDSA